MRTGVGLLATVGFSALFLCVITVCGKSDPLQQEIRTLQERTMPPGAQLVERANLLRDDRSASAQWEYQTDWDWEKYVTWVSDNLAPDYQVFTREGMRLEFRRRTPGDVFELEIESSIVTVVRRIRVNFRTHPD